MTSCLIAGSTGLVGRSLVAKARKLGFQVIEVSSKNCDLTKFDEINNLLKTHNPDIVIDAAAKVGGILANSKYPVEFLENNTLIQLNLFRACHIHSISKLVFLGSSCVYPKFATQPISENELLNGKLEPTNDAYAIAKISGIKLIQAYRKQFNYKWISVMPTNLFGKFDNFSLENSHLIPALIRKFNEAKGAYKNRVTLWGTGSPKREVLYSDHFADMLFKVIEKYDSDEPINIGTGVDHSIKEIAELVRDVVEVDCEIDWDTSKPDGTPRKLLDVTKLKNLDIPIPNTLKQDLIETNKWYLDNLNNPELKL